MNVVTCRTVGCGNAGHGFSVPLPDPNEAGEHQYLCGVCGLVITDVKAGT